jgi:2,3-bisphosphoglycerate-dependent phosphoglycerate mutase
MKITDLWYTVGVITILFEAHSTSQDNEAGLASGWYDTPLSLKGQAQAREMGERYKDVRIDAVFCSDLQRSYRTAEIAFGTSLPIIRDERLRECNYGELNRGPKTEVEGQRLIHVSTPFPSGESYLQTSHRIALFLDDLEQYYQGKTILIVGHRATQYGLEHWLKNELLEKIVTEPWQWQPGWKYELIQ